LHKHHCRENHTYGKDEVGAFDDQRVNGKFFSEN